MAFIKTQKAGWTPTFVGGTTSGTATGTLSGNYVKTGLMVEVTGTMSLSAMTGTGDAIFGNFPFSFAEDSFGSIRIDASGWAWPAGTTQITLQGLSGTTTAKIICSGSATSASYLQCTNAAIVASFTIVYRSLD